MVGDTAGYSAVWHLRSIHRIKLSVEAVSAGQPDIIPPPEGYPKPTHRVRLIDCPFTPSADFPTLLRVRAFESKHIPKTASLVANRRSKASST